MIIIYEIWMKSFMPCQVRMMTVNQTSWIEPVCKKARTSAGTLYTDGNWCAEDKRRAIIIESDCELNVIIGNREDGVDGVVIMEMEH